MLQDPCSCRTRCIWIAAALCFALFSLAGPASSATCIHQQDRWPYGPSNAVAAIGGHCLAGSGSALVVLDVSLDTDPREIWMMPMRGPVRDIEINDGLAFVCETRGLSIIDVHDPEHPIFLGCISTPGTSECVAVQGQFAFVADGLEGLRILDVSDPSSLVEVGYYDRFLAWVFRVVVSGDLAFAATSHDGLTILDISSPADPHLIRSYETPGYAYGIALSGSYCMVCSWPNLVVFDVSDPSNAILAGSIGIDFGMGEIVVSEALAYIAAGYGGLQIYDISRPADPTLIGATDEHGSARNLSLDGDRAYLAYDEWGVRAADISNPLFPSIDGIWNVAGSSEDVAVADGIVLLANHYHGTRVFDASDAANLHLVGDIPTDNLAYQIVADGGIACVEDGDGIHFIDISDPSNPSEISVWQTQHSVYDMALSEDRLYVSTWNAELIILDVSLPDAPSELGRISTSDNVLDLAVYGDHLFLYINQRQMALADISIPSEPLLLPLEDFPGGPLAVSGNTLYIVERDFGLRVFDIGDPWNPIESGNLSLAGYFSRIFAKRDLVVIAGGASFCSIDVSDPESPVLLDCSSVEDWTRGMAFDGGTAFLANNRAGLSVLDVRACRPLIVSTVKKLHDPFRLKILGENFEEGLEIYIGDGFWGDSSDPSRVRWKDPGRIILKKGKALRDRFPKGSLVPVRIVNPSGRESTFYYQRDGNQVILPP